MDHATCYSEWLQAAEAHDQLTGAADWRNDDGSSHYDASELRACITRWQALRQAGEGLQLAQALTADLYRHQSELSAADPYDVALAGPKNLVERFLEEAEASLHWLADNRIPGVSSVEKAQRFATAAKVFGRSALLLSGGATLGFHHLGVVKALFEADLLPHILSGASTGAMIAAGICVRTDDEIAQMYADTDSIRLDGLKPAPLGTAARNAALLDPAQLYEVLRHNVGDHTFAEAFAHSGRALNIAVAPTRTHQKPRLLTHITAPEVLVASAALASSALPTLFPPVVLEARRQGSIVEYISAERWVDGSLHEDLPKLRLARLHNVNHFIVSQTNPHVLPFVRHHGQRGLRPLAYGLASAAVRTQGAFAVDTMRRLNRRSRGPVRQLADRAYALVNQDYGGDIDIHPQFRWNLYRKMVANPTRADLAQFIREGERSVWPKLARIRNQTRISRAFRECVTRVRDDSTG